MYVYVCVYMLVAIIVHVFEINSFKFQFSSSNYANRHSSYVCIILISSNNNTNKMMMILLNKIDNKCVYV